MVHAKSAKERHLQQNREHSPIIHSNKIFQIV